MLKGQDIICISSIDWDFIWQSHQQVMSTFASNNNRVLFIENTGVRPVTISDIRRLKKRVVNWLKSVKGFREESKNLYIYSPIILPFPYSRLAGWINKKLLVNAVKRWMKATGFHEPIIWTYLPTPVVLGLIDEIPHKALIYYVADNLSTTSLPAKKITAYEETLLKKADLVFVMPKNMLEYCRSFNQNVMRVPMGVDTKKFLDNGFSNVVPKELEGLKQPIIGYVGGLRSCVDQDLIIFLAERFPGFKFVFVGPIQTDISRLKKVKNLIFVGQKPHAELPGYVKQFDVAVIVYKNDAYGNSISSGKLNEYLIMGKPVVSTDINEAKEFNKDNGGIIYVASNYEEFASLVSKAIKEDGPELKARRRQVAENNSWDKKTEQMSAAIDNIIANRNNECLDWKERLLKFYKYGHRKLSRIVLAISIVWILLFYTPVVWYLAEPLKISHPVRKADCIVVFAGGVGESGKAGQGYEERVEYAVRLYKQGFASHMIFSSGYVYVFKEPLVMKALAVQLGVLEGDILLEDKAGSTYQNVKFTKEALDKNNWKDILLISAPYHMKRASLVFNKIANDINVTFVPLPHGSFYAHPDKTDDGRRVWKRTNLKQIKGILHEYLGIIYYWWKGWI